jgi:hypothetical protein
MHSVHIGEHLSFGFLFSNFQIVLRTLLAYKLSGIRYQSFTLRLICGIHMMVVYGHENDRIYAWKWSRAWA